MRIEPAYDLPIRGDISVLRTALKSAKNLSYWLDTPDRPDARPAVAGDTSVDLLIVGGGFAGLWTAVKAIEENPGRTVAVVEANRIAWAATGRNGGFAEASLTHGEENGRRYFAKELARLERIAEENFEGFASDIDRLGIDAEYEGSGTLIVATEPHQVDGLRQGDSQSGEFFDGSQLKSLVQSPLFRAGRLERKGAALVHPAKLAWGLAEQAENRGVRICENTRVTSIKDRGARVAVKTPKGTISAGQVVLATNGFPALLTRNRLRTVPVYDYVLMTEPLTNGQLENIGWTGRFGMTDMSHQFHYYRKTADNRILWGGYDAVYYRGGAIRPEYDVRDETFLRLADHFYQTFPQLSGLPFSHAWGGAIDMSSRLVAFHGTAMRGKVAYSSGFTGLGVVATRFAADVMLDLLAERNTERTTLHLVKSKPLPLPPEPIAYLAVSIIKKAIENSDRNGGKDGILLKAASLVGYSFDT